MSFSPGLMQGLLNANTAMTSAQSTSSTISRMQARKETLKAEAASGYGDVEGKQKEIERIDAQTEKAARMQQSALNQASSQLGAAISTKEEEDAGKVGAKASDKAQDKAKDLQDRLSDHEVAAVDYENGMRLGSEGRTSVAVSPEFLEKMADDSELSETYAGRMETMRELENSASSPLVASQGWSVDRNGLIYHRAQVAEGTSPQEAEALRESMRVRDTAAFGSAFGGAIVTGAAPKASGVEAGLLVDASA